MESLVERALPWNGKDKSPKTKEYDDFDDLDDIELDSDLL